MLTVTMLLLENLYCSEGDFLRANECLKTIQSVCLTPLSAEESFFDTVKPYLTSSTAIVDLCDLVRESDR